jgi:serine/threonine protein kinase
MTERGIFEAALEIQNPADRRAYLDQACANQPELRSRIETLLESHDTAGSFLDVPVVDQLQTIPSEESDRTLDFPRQMGAKSDSVAENDDSISLSFLRASKKPGSLGTLAHYEVLQVLGQGGFGIVLKAFDEKLHRLVAIKVLNPEMAATSPPRKRFLREARAAAAIRHENVVQVYSVDEQPLPYLVMEYIDGQTLQQKMDGAGPLETLEVLHISRQIASGLAAAHAMGLIHRDIKPANILLEQGAEQKVKITDFGLARAADDASMTRTGNVCGTPMYMAPEQAQGHTLDHRADLFSFGSVLYQMACGRPPFRAPTTVAVLRRVSDDTPRPLQEVLPEIPDWLVAIVTKLHAKKPEDRFQTAKEVADLLACCQSDLQLKGEVTCIKGDESLRDSKAASRPHPTTTPSESKVDRSLRDRNGSSHGVTRLLSRKTTLFAAGVIGVAVLVGLLANHFGRGAIPNSTETQRVTESVASGTRNDAPPAAITATDASQGRSAWDDLDAAPIPEAERVPRQPEGLVAVLGQHRRRVWNAIYSTAVSPDGTQFLLTTDDGLYLFGRDAKQPARFFNLGVRHSSATFLPDGRIAAFVTDGVVQKTQLLIFAKPRDGMPLEKQATTNTNNNELIHHATASSDGHWLAAFDQSEGICLWRLGDAPPQRLAKFVLPKLEPGIRPCGFSPDAHWFCFTDSSQGQTAVHLIDLRGDMPREAAVLKADADENSDAPAKGFEQAAFLSDGRLATADRNGRIWFWKINDGELQRVGSIRDSGLIAAASQSLRLAVHNLYVDLRVWDLAADPPQLLGSGSSRFEGDNIFHLAIAPNGETVFTGHLNGAVRFWNVTQSEVTELDPLIPNPHGTQYGRVKVADRVLCAAQESSRLGIWRPTRDGLQAVPIESPAFMVLDASPTRRQLIVRESVNGGGTALFRCDADRLTPIRRITGSDARSAALNDESRRLAIGRDNGTDEVVELWGWESDDDLPARKLSEIKSSSDVVQLAFAEAGHTLVGRLGLAIQIWNMKEDQLIPRTMLPPSVFHFALAPDGQTLATAGDEGLKLWNLKSDLTQPTTSFSIPVTRAVAFSPDGRRLAASFWENGASAGVQIINLATEVVEKRLTFPGRVHELTFTDDSRHLITGNANATIYVVRLQDPPTK